eukprot:m.280914 g.280914  ORF g.280914 m.280914 type:complete len:216 (-) comp15751_c2_seq3:256-903(-)
MYTHMRTKQNTNVLVSCSVFWYRCSTIGWLSVTVADLIFSIVMQTFMMAEASFLALLPTYGQAMSFCFTCWVASLYCFEYSWLSAGMSLDQRRLFFERNWLYCLGFGVPITLATFFLNFVVGTGVFSLLFPFFVILATAADPVPRYERKSMARVKPPPPNMLSHPHTLLLCDGLCALLLCVCECVSVVRPFLPYLLSCLVWPRQLARFVNSWPRS